MQYLIKQAKFRIVLLRVFAAGVWMFFHQEHVTLFNLRSVQGMLMLHTVKQATVFKFSKEIK